MSLDQGHSDAASVAVPPQRTPVEFDPESNGLRIGPYERRIADPSDPDQVFGAYLSLLYTVRGAQPGEPLKLRSADLEALLAIVGDDPETIEQRLVALMGCTAQEARVIGGALLRHRRLTATLGVAGALAMGGVIAGDDVFSGSSPSDPPRAAVVQSVADGLRALDDAGYPYGSAAPSAASPAAVSMPSDDWTGSRPVGGSPEVSAETPSSGGGGVSAETPVADVPAPDVPVPASGGGAPAAVDPVVGVPVAEVPAAAPAPVDAPTAPVEAVVPAPVVQPPVVSIEAPTAPVTGGGTTMPVVDAGTTPAVPDTGSVIPPVAGVPHDNRDKEKNQNNGGGNAGDAATRDDNGKHGRPGQHVEQGNGSSNLAGGVVP